MENVCPPTSGKPDAKISDVSIAREALRGLASTNVNRRASIRTRLAEISDDEYYNVTKVSRQYISGLKHRVATFQALTYTTALIVVLIASSLHIDRQGVLQTMATLVFGLVAATLIGGRYSDNFVLAYREMLAAADSHPSLVSASVLLMKIEGGGYASSMPSRQMIYEALSKFDTEAEVDALIGAADRRSLAALLGDPYDHVPLTLEIISILKRIGGSESLSAIMTLCSEPMATENMRKIRAAARNCYPEVSRRAEREATGSELLRPSVVETSGAEELLRSATSTSDYHEDLLRPT